ncbi:transglutaminase family protein [Kineococcus arenarius]|uniref:transglutaminase family protein n=1 Tax=Kineococcus sp. SYSU DK007 TaxID=3383128 RepID=UPI003D7D7EC9
MTRSARTACWAGVASAAAVLSLRPLVVSSGWLVGALGVVLAVTGTGLLVRALLHRRGVAVVLQVLVLVLALVVLFGGATTVLGVLPTAATATRFAQLFGDGVQVVQRYSVPAADLRGLRLLLVGGAGLLALAVDVLAVTLRRPALAGVPLAAPLAVALCLVPGGSSALALVATAVPYLVLLATGRPDPRWPAPARRRRPAAQPARRRTGDRTGATAGALAAGSLALALAVPAAVPGLDERPLTLDTGTGDTIAVINPILNLKASLGARSDTTILTYTTDQEDPAPLRIVTADVFDGETWAPGTGADIARSQRVQDGLSEPPGLSPEVRAQAVEHRTSISVRGLDQTYLPLPYPAVRVEIAGEWLYEEGTLNVVGDGETTRGRDYVVQHLEVDPTENQLRGAGQAPEDVRERYTALPDSLPQTVRDAALEVTAESSDDYERAAALQRYFRSTGGFTYSTTAPNDGGSDAVAAFLRDKSGFCVQFASAMAVMARSLDIPARVAIGFLPGEESTTGSWRISAQDAHAWPELYFEGVGWVRFEPTPATRTGQSPAYSVPSVQAAAPATGAAVPSASAPAAAAPSATTSTATAGAAAQAATGPLTGWQRVAALPWGWIVGALLALLALLAPWTSATLLTRRRWTGAHDGPSSAEAAWADLEDRVGDLGVHWPPSATPRSCAALVETAAELPAGAREQLTALRRAVEGARFGHRAAAPAGAPDGAAGGDAVRPGSTALLQRPAAAGTRGRRVVRAQVDEVVEALAARRPLLVRWRARWFPGAGVRAVLAWWERD